MNKLTKVKRKVDAAVEGMYFEPFSFVSVVNQLNAMSFQLSTLYNRIDAALDGVPLDDNVAVALLDARNRAQAVVEATYTGSITMPDVIEDALASVRESAQSIISRVGQAPLPS